MADQPSQSSRPSVFSKLHEQVVSDEAQREQQIMRERLAHYAKKAEKLEGQLRAIEANNGEFRALIEDLKDAVVAADPYDRYVYDFDHKHSIPIYPVAMVSDWQTGERIDRKETEGFGAFNWAIQQKRVGVYTSKYLDWVNMHRAAGFPINEGHVFSLADHVSGNIHHELEVTNEFPVMVAVANAGTLLGEQITRLAAHFDVLHVHEVSADNHGRLTRKNQWKQGAKNNFSYLVHVIANSYARNTPNIVIHHGDGTKLIANVAGKRFLLSHGHETQMWLGIPYYGLERARGREASKRMNTDKTFDYIAIGHFHVPAFVSGNIIINGALTGTTEFDHSQGRSSEPSQVSFMVHPKYGVFDWTPWKFPVEGSNGDDTNTETENS